MSAHFTDPRKRVFSSLAAIAAMNVAGVLTAGCGSDFDPATLLLDVRVLAVDAPQPELSPGEKTTLTALHFPESNVTVNWSYCTEPPPAGSADLVNTDCLENDDAAAYLVSLGTGDSVDITMPNITLSASTLPDASDGIYLPVIVRVTGQFGSNPPHTDTGVYRLRYHIPVPPASLLPKNNNPTLTGIEYTPVNDDTYNEDAGVFTGDGGTRPGQMFGMGGSSMSDTSDGGDIISDGGDIISDGGDIISDGGDIISDGGGGISDGGISDNAPALSMKWNDKISLVALFAPGSAENYEVLSSGTSGTVETVTETLQVKWYSTAGTFNRARTGPDEATVFTLDQFGPKSDNNAHPPAAGSAIDIYAIGRDERGGTAWLHRTVLYSP